MEGKNHELSFYTGHCIKQRNLFEFYFTFIVILTIAAKFYQNLWERKVQAVYTILTGVQCTRIGTHNDTDCT